jgi:preprotein translocase subunit Sec63
MHRDASAEEIHEAYRELARTCHPDLNPSDPEAEKRFEEVQAAFDVLSDPEQRAAYNRTEISFTTARRSAARVDADIQLALRAVASVRRQARTRPSRFSWQGSLYVPPMIVTTVAWLIVVLLSVGLLDLSHHKSAFPYEQAKFFTFLGGLGKSLCVSGTLIYGIVMFVLLGKHFNR